MRSSVWFRYSLYAACLAFLAAFLVAPVALTVRDAFVERVDGRDQFTLAYILDVFRDPVLLGSLGNSLVIAAAVTALSLALAGPLALIAARFEFRGKALLSALLLVPLILPPFVGAIGMQQVLGRYGTINALLIDAGWVSLESPIDFLGGARLWGVIVIEALHLYPIVYLNVTAALANLDPAMEQAADNLGAGPWTRFRRIVLPLIRPGLFAGSTIVFIWSFTELGTPLMFEYTQVAPVQIFWGIQEIDSPRPFALVVVVLAISAACYLLGRATLGRRSYTATTRASVGAATRRLGAPAGLLAAAPFVIITALAVLPHLGVVVTSLTQPGAWYMTALPEAFTLDHYVGEQGALQHDLAVGSIRNSLGYAVLAMAVDIVLGLAIAWLVVRGRVLGRNLLDAAAMLPLAVPGLVMAFGYVAMSTTLVQWFEANDLDPPPLLAIMGENPNPVLFLVIAYAVRRLPYVVRSAAAGLEQTPVELEEAAAVLGASRATRLRRVIGPLIMANLIAGGLLAFSFAMLEVSDSLILAQTREHYPITKAIFVLFDRLGDGLYVASAMGVWGMALLTLTLVGASLLMGKRLGAIFRM